MHSFGRPLIIANPSAGPPRSQILPRLRAALDARGLGHDLCVSVGAGSAATVAREAVVSGRRYLIAVGGDGTVHEIVNGVVDAETGTLRGDDPVLAIVSAGSGCDLARTFGLDRSPEVLAGHLVTEATMNVDVGRIRLTGRSGEATTVVFANIAQAGFGGTVVAASAYLPRRLGGRRYPLATVAAAAAFRRVTTTVAVDGGSRSDPVSNVVVANGQFFGGGMLVAPRALPSDGRLNVQSWGGTPADVLRARRLLAHGAHLARDDVREWQSTAVEIHGERPLTVEADGELIGRTPAQFDVLPGMLRLKT